MGVPAAEDWFSFSIRRNRKSFIIASLLLVGVILIVFLALLFFRAGQNAATVIMLIFGIPYVICCYSLSAQRLRDMNLTGWLALLWIPAGIADRYVGGAVWLAFLIILCVIPGTAGANRYGPDPLGR